VKQKYIDKVHFHENLESLHKHFDKRFLPESLGGDLTEEEAAETDIVENVLKNDIPYEGEISELHLYNLSLICDD